MLLKSNQENTDELTKGVESLPRVPAPVERVVAALLTLRIQWVLSRIKLSPHFWRKQNPGSSHLREMKGGYQSRKLQMITVAQRNLIPAERLPPTFADSGAALLSDHTLLRNSLRKKQPEVPLLHQRKECPSGETLTVSTILQQLET
ncbi:hypothetical protein EK904_003771 [Melospiza melodia maxima]|nr:hypothetical protein EK904_003771 [Melospiza melodia maxima]